jgi:peptidoglycan/xylan/chitin deacetylase (PgdA/CDA1 family)
MMVPILMYHDIAERAAGGSRLCVPPAAFAAQLGYLAANGFSTVTARELAARTSLPARTAVITFDDGFADFHSHALPLLRQYGFTATVFVTTGWIADAGRHSAGIRPAAMLTWSQIAEAAQAGIEIGAHSHGHPQLDQLGAGRLRSELTLSKSLLEDALGTPVPGLAYPFGYSSPRVRRVAAESGYTYACAVGNTLARPQRDDFALDRLTVRAGLDLDTFGRAVHGQDISRIYRTDRVLNRGYAILRRGRAIVTGVPVRALQRPQPARAPRRSPVPQRLRADAEHWPHRGAGCLLLAAGRQALSGG